MSWVTWRQHRIEGLWALLATALLAAAIGYITLYERSIPDCSGPGSFYCFNRDFAGVMAEELVTLNLFSYALVVFPALAGAFIGAPLVAREIETGTHRLAWTQGVTRARWLLVKLAFVIIPLLAAALAVGVLEVVFLDLRGSQANHWAFFDQQAPMTVASTFFALALGVAAGAVIGRSLPAMAATLLAYVVTRIGIAVLAREHYMPALLVKSSDPSRVGVLADPTAWWLGQADAYDASGHLLGTYGPGLRGEVGYLVQYYQPGDRFWTFQTIESAILAGLAAVLLGFAVYWVTRRVT